MSEVKWICVVDDKADFRFILRKLFTLSFSQYPVHLFENGQVLLDELPRQPSLPSLILLDYHMPVLNGYRTLCQLKQQAMYQAIPVVMMSAQASAAEIKACYQAGANSFLRKPITFQRQLELVGQLGQYWLQTNLPGE
jgi:CheY-like chemotaxis protein